MKTARFLLAKGFTLVELLIVIALIGVLAVAVLAAINPLEQLNRARDTGMESDASQLLAAIDRYYASQEEFPWVTVDEVASNDVEYGFTSAKTEGVGVCGADCDTPGLLLEQLELKSEFLNRGFITAEDTETSNLLYIGKDEGASTSVYACWVPLSQAKRAQAAYTIAVDTATRTAKDDCMTDDTIDWQALGTSCVICIPR